MSTQVNSPALLAKIRPMSELSKDLNNYLSQVERIITQIYQRSGGTVDTVSDVEILADENDVAIYQSDATIAELTKRVIQLEHDLSVNALRGEVWQLRQIVDNLINDSAPTNLGDIYKRLTDIEASI